MSSFCSKNKFSIWSIIVSIISLLYFLVNGNFSDIVLLTTSIVIGLLPFLIDSLSFLEDTKPMKRDKTFKILRTLTIGIIIIISLILLLKILIVIGLFIPAVSSNNLYFCLKDTLLFENLNNKLDFLFVKIFSVESFCISYSISFLLSVINKINNSYHYRKKMESIRCSSNP